MIVTDEIMGAIHAWVVAGSELAPGNVIWEEERGPRPPTGCYISLTIGSSSEVGRDPVRVESPAGITVVADAGTDTLAALAHGYVSGAGPFQATSTTSLPGGVLASTDYWVIRVDANTLQLASSKADALAGTEIPLSSAGVGTLTLTPFWIVYWVEGHRTADFTIQCFVGGGRWRDARPVERLARVLASRALPTNADALREAGIGFGSMGPVQALRGERSTLLDDRAVVTLTLNLVSRLTENGSWIERVEIEPTISSISLAPFTVSR